MTEPFGRFFLPGPTEVRAGILAAMTGPMIPHRGRDFETLFARIDAGLRDVLLTGRPVYVSTASATGLMEASVRNAPRGAVLACVNGAFAQRFAEVARACGHEVDVLDVPLGRAVDPADVERRLAARRHVAVTVVHSETSTGALTDVRAVAEVARRHGAMCLVDSVTGVGGAELHTDEWGMDFVFTGSQKALALPPGLALGVASAGFVERARGVADRGRYFDVVEFEQFAQKHQTPNTPALSLLYALDAQLADISREGIERRWERHARMRDDTAAWAARVAGETGLAVGILAPEGERSPTVSAITLPDGLSGPAVVEAVAEHGITIGGGYGPLRERTVRIGHMGDHTPEGLAVCLATLEAVLVRLTGGGAARLVRR